MHYITTDYSSVFSYSPGGSTVSVLQDPDVVTGDDGKQRKKTFIRDPHGKEKARMVDKIARKLFPAAFLLFNFIYWLTYIFWKVDSSSRTKL